MLDVQKGMKIFNPLLVSSVYLFCKKIQNESFLDIYNLDFKVVFYDISNKCFFLVEVINLNF